MLQQLPSNSKTTDNNNERTLEPRSSTTQSSSSGMDVPRIAPTGSGSEARDVPPAAQRTSQPTTSMLNTDPIVHGAILAQNDEQDIKYAVQEYGDDRFFSEPRVRYNELRGILRRCFSIWVYSHCEFIKVFSIHPSPIAN